ncbi:MAG: hypothetical protein F6K28_27865, partial [Microcoleus sp. SIO2G3]|nr:hypothetical protein [Microcoleus sp. SIO2G3]
MAAEQSNYRPYAAQLHPAIASDPRLPELLSKQPAPNSLPSLEFTGRQAELQQAIALLQQLRSEPGSARVLAIVGQAGVGKSAFALRLAHQIKPISLPSLYFNLRGDRPVSPAAIEQQVQTALTVGNRPILILLDNLEEQTLIRPLLRLGDRALLVVTSRQPLEAAVTLELSALSESDAIALLQAIAPSKLAEADRDIARSIVRCCDALPLALRI